MIKKAVLTGRSVRYMLFQIFDLAISEKYERILNFSFLFTYSRLNKAVSY